MKKVVLLTFCTLFSILSIAQSPEDNERNSFLIRLSTLNDYCELAASTNKVFEMNSIMGSELMKLKGDFDKKKSIFESKTQKKIKNYLNESDDATQALVYASLLSKSDATTKKLQELAKEHSDILSEVLKTVYKDIQFIRLLSKAQSSGALLDPAFASNSFHATIAQSRLQEVEKEMSNFIPKIGARDKNLETLLKFASSLVGKESFTESDLKSLSSQFNGTVSIAITRLAAKAY